MVRNVRQVTMIICLVIQAFLAVASDVLTTASRNMSMRAIAEAASC